MTSLKVDKITYDSRVSYRPSERGSGTINMILEADSIDVEGELLCGNSGGDFDFRAYLVNNGHEERVGEIEVYQRYELNDWTNQCGEDGAPERKDFDFGIAIEEDIVTQYSNGSFDDLSVGDAKWVIKRGDFHWTGDSIDDTWEFDVTIDSSGLPIAQNAYSDLVEVFKKGDGEIGTKVDIYNPANHGITYTGTYEYLGNSKEVSHSATGVISIGGENVTTVEDTLNVSVDKYGPVEVSFEGETETTNSNMGTKEIAESNVSIVDCGASISKNSGYPDKTQTLDVSITVENMNRAEVPVQVAWSIGGNKVMSEEISVPKMSESTYEGQINHDLPLGDSDVSVEIESVNV